jgi:hypothetical protein
MTDLLLNAPTRLCTLAIAAAYAERSSSIGRRREIWFFKDGDWFFLIISFLRAPGIPKLAKSFFSSHASMPVKLI